MLTLLNGVVGVITIVIASATYLYSAFNEPIKQIQVAIIEAFDEAPTLYEIGYYKDKPIKLSKKDINCLELNVFHEAGAESYQGKIAVAQVTYNRLRTGKWGNNICSVVYAPSQFSWTRQKKRVPRPEDIAETKRAVEEFISGLRINTLQYSLYFHAAWIEPPFWIKRKAEVDRIGQHVFYEPKYKVEYVASND
jgi:N-acetylmuramoyl-L-alanine amidase